MNDESHQGLTKQKFICMLLVSFCCFDIPRLATGIIPLAATIPAGMVGWIPLLGQLIAGTVLEAGSLFQTFFGWVFSILGYSTMGIWFMNYGVSLFGGKNPAGRVATFFCTLLLSLLPILNLFLFFNLTVWTFKMGYDALKENKNDMKEHGTGYNRKNARRVRRRYVHANT